jgi:drug/metabolite transporter (DMT)-like permease
LIAPSPELAAANRAMRPWMFAAAALMFAGAVVLTGGGLEPGRFPEGSNDVAVLAMVLGLVCVSIGIWRRAAVLRRAGKGV